MSKTVADRLLANDFLPEELARKDVWAWQRKWREVFASELHAATGKWQIGGHDWSVFTMEYADAAEGLAAENAYMRIAPTDFVIVSAWSKKDFGYRASGQPPAMDIPGMDLLVFPESLEWTMVYTHEDYIGPFFALAPEA